MDYLILSDGKGGTARLTTNARASSQGVPVLVLDDEDVQGAFRAADELPTTPTMTAADLIVIWGSQPSRTNEEKDAARRYLLDWTNGPQL